MSSDIGTFSPSPFSSLPSLHNCTCLLLSSELLQLLAKSPTHPHSILRLSEKKIYPVGRGTPFSNALSRLGPADLPL